MNGKSAKLLRSYCGQVSREGSTVVYKHAKRRYLAVPWTRRGPAKKAMREYLGDVIGWIGGDTSMADLRRQPMGLKRVAGPARSRFMQIVASLLGMGGGR
jgi:hypothetical protein